MRNNKKTGFADTKKYPHRGHPAEYRKLSQDEIEYLTFTHHAVVVINGKAVYTIPLNDSISPKEREENKKNAGKRITSFVYPKKYIGKRSALGKERTDLQPTKTDEAKINELFGELPVEYVRYSKRKK